MSKNGFSLIELMISLLISSVITLAVISIFHRSKINSQETEKNATVKNSVHLLGLHMRDLLQPAGFIINPVTTTQSQLFTSSPAGQTNIDGSQFFAGALTTGLSNYPAPGTDSLSIRFQTDSNQSPRSCNGVINPPNQIITNTLYVTPEKKLICKINGQQEITVAEHIDKIRFFYGVDLNDDRSVDLYLDAANLTARDYWRNVYAIKIMVTPLDAGKLASGIKSPSSNSEFIYVKLQNRPD